MPQQLSRSFVVALACTCVASLVATASPLARAQGDAESCARGTRPWLRIDFEGSSFTDAERARVQSELAAELDRRGIAVCAGASGAPVDTRARPPLADIAMHAANANAVTIRIDVGDAVTGKHLSREVSLARVPADARALTLSLATDELLRASWLELAMTPPPSQLPATPPPPEVKRAVVQSIAPADERRTWNETASALGFAGAFEHATGGQSQWGIDGRASLGLSDRFALGVRFGYRSVFVVASDHGDIGGNVLLGGVGASFALASRASAIGADLFVRADLLRAEYFGRSDPSAFALRGTALGALGGGGLAAWMRITGTWHLTAELSAAAPIRAVAATDAGHESTGLTGAVFGGALGIAASL